MKARGHVTFQEVLKMLGHLSAHAGVKTDRLAQFFERNYDLGAGHYTTPESRARALGQMQFPQSDPYAGAPDGMSWGMLGKVKELSNKALREAVNNAPWSAVATMSPAMKVRLQDWLRTVMTPKQSKRLATRWGMTKDHALADRPWLFTEALLHGTAAASTPAPIPAAAPKADAHQWEPVKGKPGRRKRRLPSGRWHYEDVPMRKAGESMRDYIGRLCARVHELVP